MSKILIAKFQKTVWNYYREHKREMSWRPPELELLPSGEALDPYFVVISEVMLQQTQVNRVQQKFPIFITEFPSFEVLASASTADVLRVWQGMGYNRRALYLHSLSRKVVSEYGGRLPGDPIELATLPGIGAGTAGSIAAFAFNAPVVFMETNIRRVFLYHFFSNQPDVSDKKLLPIIERALDRTKPREWYYALMDYGAHLAATAINPNRLSKHYVVQSRFEGSDRQIRGRIIRLLIENKQLSHKRVLQYFEPSNRLRVEAILTKLTKEGFINKHYFGYRLIENIS